MSLRVRGAGTELHGVLLPMPRSVKEKMKQQAEAKQEAQKQIQMQLPHAQLGGAAQDVSA